MPEGLKELYIDELKDIYNAENQLVKALPKMARAATVLKNTWNRQRPTRLVDLEAGDEVRGFETKNQVIRS